MKKHKLPGYINGNYSFVKLHLCHLFPISLKFVGIDKTVQPATLLQQLPLRGMQKKQEGGGVRPQETGTTGGGKKRHIVRQCHQGAWPWLNDAN